MKNYFILLLAWSCFTSCTKYLDTTNKEISSKSVSFNFKEHFNEFKYFNPIKGSADGYKFDPTHFSIILPKKLRYWCQIGNKFYFEYDGKQFIRLDIPYKNQGEESDKWFFSSFAHDEVIDFLEEFWQIRGEKYDFKLSKMRNTKLYSNGKYKIYLINIRKKNLMQFTEFIKTFKVVDSARINIM